MTLTNRFNKPLILLMTSTVLYSQASICLVPVSKKIVLQKTHSSKIVEELNDWESVELSHTILPDTIQKSFDVTPVTKLIRWNSQANLDLDKMFASFLEAKDLHSLRVIAERSGLERLGYSKSKGFYRTGISTVKTGAKHSLYEHNTSDFRDRVRSMLHSVNRTLRGKSRYDIKKPLDQLITTIEAIPLDQLPQDSQDMLISLLVDAHYSLNALCSIYKMNPKFFSTSNAKFNRFLDNILLRLNNVINKHHHYDTIPWQHAVVKKERDHHTQNNLQYLDLETKDSANIFFNLGPHSHSTINRALRFIPTKRQLNIQYSEKKEKIALVIIHGTTAGGVQNDCLTLGQSGTEFYKDQTHFFEQIKYDAQILAQRQDTPVDVFSFGWNGGNTQEDRVEAAADLAKFIRLYLPENEYRVMSIAHSHGGNVAHLTSQILSYENRQIEYAINIATPSRSDHVSTNFGTLINLYSDYDYVQYGGSFEMNVLGSGNYLSGKDPRTLSSDEGKRFSKDYKGTFANVKLYNVRVTFDGEAPGHSVFGVKNRFDTHSAVKHVAAALPKLLPLLLQEKSSTRNFPLFHCNLENMDFSKEAYKKSTRKAYHNIVVDLKPEN